MIEQTRFLSTVFLCSEFKLENIYSGVIFICGNLFLRIAEETAKLRTRKNFVPYSIDQEIIKEILEMGYILHLAIS